MQNLNWFLLQMRVKVQLHPQWEFAPSSFGDLEWRRQHFDEIVWTIRFMQKESHFAHNFIDGHGRLRGNVHQPLVRHIRCRIPFLVTNVFRGISNSNQMSILISTPRRIHLFDTFVRPGIWSNVSRYFLHKKRK